MEDLFKKNLQRSPGWIQTITKKKFCPMDPKTEDINITDIAISLSRQCRFTGHTHRFYSVAEHSVRVCWLLPQYYKKWGLMHDAAEAYIGDMASPIKKLFPKFTEMEEKIQEKIAERFGLNLPIPDEVAELDLIMLATEKRDMMDPSEHEWGPLPDPASITVEGWDWEESYAIFMMEFDKLFGPVNYY